jgi:hypothetical protein
MNKNNFGQCLATKELVPELNMKKINILKILHFSNKNYAQKKTKTTKLKAYEMNQLEMTVDESLQTKH